MASPAESQPHAPLAIGPSTLTTLGVFVGGLLLIATLANLLGAQTERLKTVERDINETRAEVREARAEVRQVREILLEEFRDNATRQRPQ